MKLFDKSTDNLLNTLQKTSPSDLKDYFQEHFEDGEPPLYVIESV